VATADNEIDRILDQVVTGKIPDEATRKLLREELPKKLDEFLRPMMREMVETSKQSHDLIEHHAERATFYETPRDRICKRRPSNTHLLEWRRLGRNSRRRCFVPYRRDAREGTADHRRDIVFCRPVARDRRAGRGFFGTDATSWWRILGAAKTGNARRVYAPQLETSCWIFDKHEQTEGWRRGEGYVGSCLAATSRLSILRLFRVFHRWLFFRRTGTYDRGMMALFLKRASASRPSGQWNDDDYDVLADGAVVGRILRVHAAPEERLGCGH